MRRVWRLLGGEVAIVRADLDANRGLDHLLSAEEAARAARFRRRIHRERYVAGRGLLRHLLAERLNADPRAVRIISGFHGKPRLDEEDGRLEFNLAHSGSDALFAFTETGDVGIDIERVRPLDPLRLSQTCFSAAEQAALAALPEESRLEAFFDGWVRKEAVIKADGRGASLGLDSFTVALAGQARLLDAPPADDRRRWSLMSLDAGPGLRAALAIRTVRVGPVADGARVHPELA